MKSACCALVVCALYLAPPALAAPSVVSDSDCPSAAAVANRLTGLWSGEGSASIAAYIRVGVGQMTVDLVNESEPAVSRILPVDPDCESRAQAAALVIAAWLGSKPSGPLGEVEPAALPSLELDRLPAPTAPAQPSPPGPSPAPAPAAQSFQPEQPRPPATPAQPSRAASSPPPTPTVPPAQPRTSLGMGVFASVDARGASAALLAEVAWIHLVGRVGLAVDLSLPLPREMAVGQGKARWWRPVLAPVLRIPLTEGTWIVQGSIGPAFGLLVVAGSGFPQNNTDTVASFGATAGFRLARSSRGRAFWADLRALLWPAAQSIRNDVPGSAPNLEAVPSFEAQLGLGFSLGAF